MKATYLLLLAVFSGCQQEPQERSHTSSPPAKVETSADVPSSSSGYGDDLAPPDPCAWASSTDAVIWGTLVELSLTDVPIIDQTFADWTWTDACDDPDIVFPAVRLRVAVDNVLHGDAPSDVVVAMGEEQLRGFIPFIRRSPETQGVVWVPNEPAFQVGQQVGMAVHYVPEYDVWSLMGETVFWSSRDSLLEFWRYSDTSSVDPPPVGAEEMTIDQLAERVAGCSASDAADARRARLWNTWGHADGNGAPNRYFSSRCWRAPTEPRGCESHADCGSDEQCDDRFCVSCEDGLCPPRE